MEKESNIDRLVRKQREHLASIQPTDVPVVLDEQEVIVRVPFVMPAVFNELADYHPPRRDVPQDSLLWFSLSGVTRAYPGIVVISDGAEDDLYRVRNKEAVYTWPEVFPVLSPEDQKSVSMAVWALNVWEPDQRHKAAREKKEVQHG